LVRETSTAYHCLPFGNRLPVVDPLFFVTDGERATLRVQVTALTVKKRRLQDRLRALDRLRDKNEQVANELDQIAHDLILDGSVHALNVIDAAVFILGANGAIDPPALNSIKLSITTAKAGLNSVAAVTSGSDERRGLDRAIDALFNAKDLVPIPGGVMSAEQAAAFKRVLNIIPKLVRISDRFVNAPPGAMPWTEIASALDDLFDASGQLFAPIKLARSTVQAIGGEVALWQLRGDRDAVSTALVGGQSARRYYQTRIGEIDDLMTFYNERLRRAGIK
jgi:hypothetical protein